MTPSVRHIRPEAPLPALRPQATPRVREDGRGAKCLYGSPKGDNSGQKGEPINTLWSAIYGQKPPFHYRHLGTVRMIATQNQRGAFSLIWLTKGCKSAQKHVQNDTLPSAI